VYNKFSN